METIVDAAVKTNKGEIFVGRRHHLILEKHYPHTKGGIQGFLTSEGRFVTREEALQIALAAGQIKEKKYDKSRLFSEELW